MRLRLYELQGEDSHTQKMRAEKPKGWEDTGVLHHQGLPYVPEIIRTKLINRYLTISHFGINRTRKLIARKYY